MPQDLHEEFRTLEAQRYTLWQEGREVYAKFGFPRTSAFTVNTVFTKAITHLTVPNEVLDYS